MNLGIVLAIHYTNYISFVILSENTYRTSFIEI